ncbi:MAG: ExeM/NucH family extracellular endonuclease, partial [Nodosilinea sp.]
MAITAGDIAFVGINATDPDQFAILALNAIVAGDTFIVTDGGYTGATSGVASAYFRPTEGFLQYTAPAGGIAAGSVLLINAGGGSAPSISRNGGGSAGTVTLLANSSSNTTNFSFSTSGDSLTAYTVSGGTHLTGTPTLIAFIGFGASPYNNSAQSSNTPTISGGQVLVLANLDNAIFTNAANAYSQTISTLSTASNFTARDTTVVDLTTLSSGSISPVPTVNLSVSSNAGTEAGTTVITVTATASSTVSSDQTVNLAVTGTGITTGDYTLNNSTITIPSGATVGSVTFTVVDDALVEGIETAILTISNPTSGITLGSTTTQNIAIADNDIPSVIITESGGSTNVTEGGATDAYTVALATQPTSNVTVTINAGTQVTTNSPTLTFTSTNWNQAQTVTVTAVDDILVEGNHTGTITHSVSSADSNYNGITVAGITVNIVDNDIAITKISAIQGSGLTAALTGVQTIEGIVTRVFAGSTKLNGFYVQEEDSDSDGNAATSEAIFVYDSTGLFTGNVGDKVRVTGTAKEFTTTSGGNTSSLTELDAITSVVNLGASTLPTVVNVQLPVTSASDLEPYEGMLVNISAATGNLTVTENYQLGRYGQVVLAADGASNQAGTDARLDQYTQFNAPSVSGYAAYQAELAKRKIYLDDGSSIQNLDPILFGRGGQPLSSTNTLRSGDSVANITGILDERFEGYRIQTTAPVNFTASNPRPETPPVVGGTLKVASFNVLNYFNDLDTNPGSNNGPNITTPNGLTFEPRGANTSTEFTRQRDKIIQVIITSGADVMGLMELENNGFGTSSAIQDLVNGLNALAGAGTYTFIDPGTSISTDAITVGIIYKPSKVTPVGAAATMPNGYGSGAFDLVGRKPLAQTFAQSSNGATFTVVVNHLKSKSSSAGTTGDADAGDGQGLSNGTRTRQAQDLATWLATKPTGTNDADYLLLGDFNAYSKEDPITTLASNGYANLLPNTSYSYVFDGQVGSLDHALATSTLSSQVIGADKWHINADEPTVLDYNTDFKTANQVTSLYNSDPYRASDHDPVVVGLNLGVNLTGVDLSNYVRIGRYNLPEPSRDTAPTGSVLAQETSAVTYNWDTDTLFVVGDGNTSIVQVSKTGQLIDSMTLTPASAQDSTTGFYDTEGLTYIGGGKFVLIEERDRRANLFTYVPNTTLTRSNVQTVKLGTTLTTPDSGNVGIEGISYDPLTGGYIAVKEISPSGIFQTGIDFAAGTATKGSATTVNSTNLFDPALAGLGDFADVYALSNQPTLNGQSQYNNLLILSQESGKIINSDRGGNISSSLTIVSDPNNPLSVPNQQFEGLTMDRNGLLYVTSENGGGDVNHPQVWIYAPASYNYTNQAPLSVSFNVITSSLVDNANTTNRVKLANIIISDDAKGTNNLTLAGADANAFEINSSTSVPELFLKAGTSLNSTTKSSYNVTVNVDDPTVGSAVDATRNFSLSVTPAPTLVISEVAPWSSGSSAVAADWFEVTNVSANAINITGWKMDDNSNSFAASVALNGITSIAAGESVIFIETANLVTTRTAFLNTWFGGNQTGGLQIGSYSGSGVGLGSGGDAVNLYDGSGNLKANVTFGSSPTVSPFATFDNSAGASSVSTLSAPGIKGAYSVTDTTSTQIGSPGKIANDLPVITLGVNPASVLEDGTPNLVYTFTRTGPTTSPLTVNYTIGGTANASDYTGATPGTGKTITFLAGSDTATVVIDPIVDTTVEADETVTLTLVSSSDYSVGTTGAVTGTITNDDLPVITLGVNPASVLEDG